MDPHNVLRLLGVDAGRVYPVAVDCPLCRINGKLEIRSANDVYCAGCQFSGDLIALTAAKQETSLVNTIKELQARSLVDYGRDSIDQYIREFERQQTIKRMAITLAQESSDRPSNTAISSVFDSLNIAYSTVLHRQLLPHFFGILVSDIARFSLSLPVIAKPVIAWLGKRRALAIPCWRGADITGLWLLAADGAEFLPLYDNAEGAAFARMVSFRDRETMIVDDISLALRMTFWATFETGRPTPFVVSYGLRDLTDHFRGGRVVYWSPTGNTRHYVRALQTPGAHSLSAGEVPKWDHRREVPFHGSFGQFQRAAAAALPAHQTLAYQLAAVPVEVGRSQLSGCTIEPSDRARVMSYLQGDDARHAAAVFAEATHDETVTWDGVTITDTPEGWMSRGKIVSSVKFYIDQVRPYGREGEAVVTGTIAFLSAGGERHNLRFQDKLSVMRKDTAGWLQAHVVSATGRIPYIDSRWSKKLIEVSQQFHTPRAVLEDQRYGWHERTLRMPNFTVDGNGVHPTTALLDGPAIAPPAPLSEAEWSTLRSTPFWRVVLALMGNLHRTMHGVPGRGIILTNEPHILERVAQLLGITPVANPPDTVVDEYDLSPIPLFTSWSGTHMARLFYGPPRCRNVVVNVDSHTSRLLSTNADWLILRVGTLIEYSALRCIFTLLPQLIRGEVDASSDSFYRDICDCIASHITDRHVVNSCARAAQELDQHYTYLQTTAATRIVELIFYGIERGDIIPTYTADSVIVPVQQFVSATASPVIPAPTISDLTDRLRDARFLVGWSGGNWSFARSAWDLNASLIGSTR